MKIGISIMFLLCAIYAMSQPACDIKALGITYRGGIAGHGTIQHFDPDLGIATTIHEFQNTNEGTHPIGALCIVGDSIAYGTTKTGGTSNAGVIFAYSIESDVFTVLHHFDGSNGNEPRSGVTSYNYMLYGTTYKGGADNLGVLFSYDLNTGIYVVLEEFEGSVNGAKPMSCPIVINNALYGLTFLGGSYDAGVIYEFDVATSVFTKMVDLNSSALGSTPQSGFTLASNGSLYALCSAGGNKDHGTLIEYVPGSTSASKKVDFSWYDKGAFPKASLENAGDGNLYGTTSEGGLNKHGTIFSFNPVNDQFTTIQSLSATTGNHSYASLEEIEGKVFGTTSFGGGDQIGSIFSLDIATGVLSGSSDYSLQSGYFPNAGLSAFMTGATYFNSIGICDGDSISLGGNWVSTEGFYEESYISSGGCDSIVNAQLDIFASHDEIDTIIIADGQPVLVHGILVSIPGSYIEIFENSAGCDSTSTVVVLDHTSVSELITNPISVYPNPTNDVLHVLVGTHNLDDAKLTLIDNSGRVIISMRPTKQDESISLKNLTSGVYYLKFISLERVETIKVIKAN